MKNFFCCHSLIKNHFSGTKFAHKIVSGILFAFILDISEFKAKSVFVPLLAKLTGYKIDIEGLGDSPPEEINEEKNEEEE